MNEIQTKIKQAKQQNLTELDLSVSYYSSDYEKIKTIPPEVFSLTQLESLNLNWHQITEIPYSFQQLTCLKSLHLFGSNLSLTQIQKILSLLPNLHYLGIRWQESFNQLLDELQTLPQLGIDLSKNQLSTLPESITKLTQLTVLDLRNNQLSTLPESIGKLTQLTVLSLRNNQLSTLPESITKLTQLTVLYLSDNQLSTLPESITKLTQLTQLYLSDNQLSTLPESITKLTQLTQLDLSGNQLSTLPESITKLTQLTQLDLSYNQLSTLPESITKLTQLTELYLSYNQLSTLPESIGKLTQLTELDLSFNQLSTLPESITKLTQLTELYLSDNQLSTLPESIGKLTQLTQLSLRNNQLSTLPESITKLTQLTGLYLSDNQLSTLPESLEKLTQLTVLNLSSNQLSTLPESLGKLTQLTQLYLSYNQLSTLPESIRKLTQLTELKLSSNQLSTLPESLGKLTQLTELDLSYNQLSTLPESIRKLTQLTELDLWNNPLQTPPLEVCDQGINAIREYFAKLQEEGYDTIYEAKFIIVGEGEAGKTSLMNKILDSTYTVPQPEQSTHGIKIKTFNFDLDTGNQFRVNIWDFGGQEIYHQTHQFFLTKRSLYALVTDSRKDHPHLDYWLQIVELLSDNSPMLMIKNEKDGCVDIKDEAQIRERFKAMVKEILDTNLSNNQGLERIINRMKEYIQELPHVGIKLPKTWANVRKAIEQDTRDYISLEAFFQLCDHHQYSQTIYPLTEETNTQSRDGRLILSQFLHDLGIILHFQDDEESLLYDTVILNPTWGTQAVYELLKKEDNLVKKNLGKFTYQDLKTIWNHERYNGKYRELLELMKRFELCYQLPNLQPTTYIAPQLLNTNSPNYHWNSQNNLRLNYRYQFMPKGILSRFIVRMHPYIEEPKVWRYGVILTYQKTRAEVIETYDNREIQIRIEGENKRGLLELITAQLDEINHSYKGLKVDVMIPCNCQTCQTYQTPHFFIIEKLRERLTNQKLTIECQNPPYCDIDIYALIDGTIGREQFNRSNQGNVMIINANQGEQTMQDNRVYQKHEGSGDNVAGDKNTTNIYNSPNLTEAAKEIKELLTELDKEYPNDSITVGVKAIEEIRNNPTLKARFINALKEGGAEAIEKLIDHPAVSIVLAAGKGFMS